MPKPSQLALAAILSLTMLTLTSGCEGVAAVAVIVTGGEKIPAAYTLIDRPTLVLVDDPHHAMGSESLTRVIAANVAYYLRENSVIKSRIIPGSELVELEGKLGDQFATTPIDQIGRLLHAEQVIYVVVDKANLRAAPGMYRPGAVVETAVIDVEQGKRLFPPASALSMIGTPMRGHAMEIRLKDTGTVDIGTRGADAVMARKLAERIGLKVAELFYKHPKEKAFDD